MQTLITITCKQRIHNFDSVKYPFYTVGIKALSTISAYTMIPFSVENVGKHIWKKQILKNLGLKNVEN